MGTEAFDVIHSPFTQIPLNHLQPPLAAEQDAGVLHSHIDSSRHSAARNSNTKSQTLGNVGYVSSITISSLKLMLRFETRTSALGNVVLNYYSLCWGLRLRPDMLALHSIHCGTDGNDKHHNFLQYFHAWVALIIPSGRA